MVHYIQSNFVAAVAAAYTEASIVVDTVAVVVVDDIVCMSMC